MALKSARIVDFCGKSSGFADFENTVDRGSAVNFGTESWIVPFLMFSNEVHLNSGVRLLLEFSYRVMVTKPVAFFTICAKLTLAFTFTTLNFYTSASGCGCDFGFEQKYWRVDGFGEKKARIGGFTPIHPPLN